MKKFDDRRHIKDLEFLEALRRASEQELRVMYRNNSRKNDPAWKRIAIERALGKLRVEPDTDNQNERPEK